MCRSGGYRRFWSPHLPLPIAKTAPGLSKTLCDPGKLREPFSSSSFFSYPCLYSFFCATSGDTGALMRLLNFTPTKSAKSKHISTPKGNLSCEAASGFQLKSGELSPLWSFGDTAPHAGYPRGTPHDAAVLT